ncbi:MAG: extracellular solute-binding protein family 1 [Paenibacillus sp.]|nr:extracellular solute-binding protein family 1 [Paenibacillus sp.]
MTKHWTTVMISALLLGTTLTACEGGGTSGSSAGEAQPAGASASPAEQSGKTTVSVSVVKKDAFLQEAERMFEEANPNIDIDIRAYVTTPVSEGGKNVNIKRAGPETNNEADLEKYRTGVNAELMSGKGSDLIALETLPYAKYADKKLLANLNDLMKKSGSFRASDYYAGIFDAVKVNGKTFALPVNFKVNMTMGNTPLLNEKGIKIDDSRWTWKDMLDIGLQAVQSGASASTVWTGMPKVDLIAKMVQSQYNKYVSGKKASFDSKEFTELLEQVRTMYDSGKILEQADMSSGGKDVFKSVDMNTPMEMLFMPQTMYDGKGTVYSTPSSGNGGGIAFSTDLMLGINEKSKNKEAALKFLEFLLSDAVQSKPMMQGFSVQKASLESQLRQTIEQLKSGRLKMMGPNGAAPSTDISEEQLNSIVKLMEKANNYAAGDPNVMKIVKEETQAFFNKAKSAKDTASMIQNRVATYLNE